ncbi:MAG: hypothetical protein LBI12_02805 [Treponema sp.]|jgi:hypothetical protein|nr:hypothetical protein [Treponema sp.]
MINRHFLFALLFFFAAAALFAGGKKEKAPPGPKIIQITGVVRLVGASPFSEIVVSNSDGRWHIADGESHLLFDMQHQTVTVEGEEFVEELRWANGQSAGTRRTLKNIRILDGS